MRCLRLVIILAWPVMVRAQSVQPQGAPGPTPAEEARSELAHPRYTAAGVQFMSGMIAHHAQAIVMAGWCQSHGASATVRDMCERIAVSQADEIKYMQDWLTARHQVVPAADPRGYAMPGMDQPMRMPGMLTAEQMAELDQARGPAFDRLFLTGMIQHHQGAIDMVQELTNSGAADDDALGIYAANVAADQAAEIGRMQRILASLDSPHSP